MATKELNPQGRVPAQEIDLGRELLAPKHDGKRADTSHPAMIANLILHTGSSRAGDIYSGATQRIFVDELLTTVRNAGAERAYSKAA